MKKMIPALVSATALMLSIAPAQAHYPWLLANGAAYEPEKTAKIYVGWGHSFPLDGFLDSERIASLTLHTPDRAQHTLTQVNAVEFNTPPLSQAGTHIVSGSQGKGYFTKTRKGGKRQSKAGLTDVVRCYYSDNSIKTLLHVEGDNATSIADMRIEQSLEIIPLTDPAQLRVGDMLSVQILHRGQPYSGTVNAVYEGFSSEGAYAWTIDSDDNGKANIRILDRGRWLVRTRVEEPYPNPEVCDVEAFNSTLTFIVR